MDKAYQFQFGNNTCTIKEKDGKVIGIGKRTRGNVFHLNPTEMTCLVAKVDNSWLWHRSFYHIDFDNIVKVSNTVAIRDMSKIIKPTNVVCKECILAKQRKVSFPSNNFTTIEKYDNIHIDMSGHARARGFYGERYFMIFINDFTGMMG